MLSPYGNVASDFHLSLRLFSVLGSEKIFCFSLECWMGRAELTSWPLINSRRWMRHPLWFDRAGITAHSSLHQLERCGATLIGAWRSRATLPMIKTSSTEPERSFLSFCCGIPHRSQSPAMKPGPTIIWKTDNQVRTISRSFLSRFDPNQTKTVWKEEGAEETKSIISPSKLLFMACRMVQTSSLAITIYIMSLSTHLWWWKTRYFLLQMSQFHELPLRLSYSYFQAR